MKNPFSIKKISIFDIFYSQASLKIKFIKLTDLCFGSILCRLLKERNNGATPDRLDRMLVIRPGGIGDAVFLLPIIRALRKKWPVVEIDILCERRNEEVFLSQPDMFRHIWSYDRFTWFFTMWKQEYDVVIDTEQWHYGSALISYFIKSQMTTGFFTRPLRAKLFDRRVNYDNNAYELENFFNLFSQFIGKEEQPKNIDHCFTIQPQDLRWIKKKGIKESVVLLLGSSIQARRLTSQQIRIIIEYFREKNLSVILLGGRDALKVGKQATKDMDNGGIVNFIGQTTLIESAALMKQSQMVIGSDSGLIHLACAVGTPVVALFGPGNKSKWAPQGKAHIIISKDVECSPCTRFGYTIPTCHKSYRCMREIVLDGASFHDATCQSDKDLKLFRSL